MDDRSDRPPRGFQRLSSGLRVEPRTAGPPPPRGRRRLEHLIDELARMQGWLVAAIDELGGPGRGPGGRSNRDRPEPPQRRAEDSGRLK